jgi:phytoene dehydrogenase-like protein
VPSCNREIWACFAASAARSWHQTCREVCRLRAQERGGAIAYKAAAESILTEGEGAGMHAVGVRLKDGTKVRAKCVISNATRWDTFGRLLPFVPENEAKFRKRYVKSPSFITLHLGIKADVLPVRAPSMQTQPAVHL